MKDRRYVMYCSRHGDETGTQIMVLIYDKAYQARKFLDALLRDDGFIWDDHAFPMAKPGSTIRSESDIVVSTRFDPEAMRKAVEFEYEPKHMAWDLPPTDASAIRRFRDGPPMPRTLEETGRREGETVRVRRTSTPKTAAPSNYVHVSTVALSMGIDAKQARVALRKIFPDGKPAYGWNFDPATLDDLKAKIKEHLK